MKYLEQRIKELETEVNLLKAKNKLEETKTTGFLNKQPIRFEKKDTSCYLNTPSPDWRNKEINDYMYNPSVNLLSEPELETAFASPWDSSEMYKNPLNTVTVNLSSILTGTFPNPEYTDSSDLPEYYPPYPSFMGSWDDQNHFTDVINENVTDDYGFKMNHEEPITSSFDKADKDFLNYLNTPEKRIENNFGKIISKFRILNHEWEMDGYGYIVNDGIQNKIVITNHNKPMVANADYLHSKIKEYKEIINETEKALLLIK